MPRKIRKEESDTNKEEDAGAEMAVDMGEGEANEAGEAQPRTAAPIKDEQAKAGENKQPVQAISTLDHSLIDTPTPQLSNQQLIDLRRKLRAKFH